MSALEIIVIVVAASIVLGVLGTFIYKKIKHLPTGECSSCSVKGNNLLSQYRKKYKKKSKCSNCKD
ncbi:MAG: hypothetical protein VB015_01645 [Erysipelotrichaceae bacterium]|nr:hypothetical protein [Erysipelotrichaceae bacterium]